MTRKQKKQSYDFFPSPLLRGVARRDGVCQPLTISFLFHFNQDIGPYTLLANRACYQGLVSVLRKHKDKKFNIHLSGTLIESLKRFAPETLKKLVCGVRDGQFELLGSTYAQNVPAATDELSNRYQIEQHLEILQKIFRVRPKGFWIPERCWKQSFVKLLSDFGYTYTLIEKQTLEKIKLQNYHLPYKTSYRNCSIAIVQDDEHFKHKINFAVWCDSLTSRHSPEKGNPESFQPALAHLETIASQKDASRSTCGERSESIAVYAEDAEASGLWGVHYGAFPQPVWKNWDLLLDCLSKEAKFKISTIGDFLQRTKIEKEIGPIPDGQAEWMVESLRKKGAPYHEDGYRDWFDFNRRSPKIKKYHKFFAALAKEIQKAELLLRGNARGLRNICKLKSLIQEAKLILCRSQYEFGCIGIGKKDYAPFEKAKECLIPLAHFWKILKSFYPHLNPLPLRERRETSPPLHWREKEAPSPRRRGAWVRGMDKRTSKRIEHSNLLQCSASEWKKFKKIVPVEKVWFKKFIASWIFDLAPPKVVQYCKR